MRPFQSCGPACDFQHVAPKRPILHVVVARILLVKLKEDISHTPKERRHEREVADDALGIVREVLDGGSHYLGERTAGETWLFRHLVDRALADKHIGVSA